MAARLSVAEALFESILAHDGYENVPQRLRAMINSSPPTFETEHIDFKGGCQLGQSKPVALTDKDIRAIWSEALAGFATTGGGVLIWGLDARPAKDSKIDQVVGENLVQALRKHHSLLLKSVHEATDPPVSGVKIESFPDAIDSDAGFIICFIPESDHKPHRTEMGGKRWVMRAGDSFVDVSPPVLRSLFFPQRRSFITIKAISITNISQPINGDAKCMTSFEFQIFNNGPATAEHPVVQFRDTSKLDLLNISSGNLFQYDNPKRWRVKNVMNIHPGDMLHLCHIYANFPVSVDYGKAFPLIRNIRFEIEVYIKDQMPQLCMLDFSSEDILNSKELSANSHPLTIGL